MTPASRRPPLAGLLLLAGLTAASTASADPAPPFAALFAQAQATAPRLAEALIKNGLSAHDVAFFIVHETADREHGEQAIAMVLDHADTRRLQDACIAEARAGAEAWLAAHGGRA